jgi:hypothetical protein
MQARIVGQRPTTWQGAAHFLLGVMMNWRPSRKVDGSRLRRHEAATRAMVAQPKGKQSCGSSQSLRSTLLDRLAISSSARPGGRLTAAYAPTRAWRYIALTSPGAPCCSTRRRPSNPPQAGADTCPITLGAAPVHRVELNRITDRGRRASIKPWRPAMTVQPLSLPRPPTRSRRSSGNRLTIDATSRCPCARLEG